MQTYKPEQKEVCRTTSGNRSGVSRQPSISRIIQAYTSQTLQRQPGYSPAAANRANGVVQRAVQIDGVAVTAALVEAALINALRSEIRFPANLPKSKQNKKSYLKDNTTLNPTGITLKENLYTRYQTLNLNLTDNDSLIHQVSQDTNLIWGGNDNLVGTPHQHSEYATDPAKRHPGHKDDTDMRIYRSMPNYAWNAASLSGHGGSLGEAMNYFRLGERDTKTNPTNIYYLVEFKLAGKKLNNMVGTITKGGEGSVSGTKFGGKSENTAEFGIPSDFFSVDIKHAATIINGATVTSKVVASTGEMPTTSTKPGSAWNATLAAKPVDWVG